jgi:uncharacterized membrane protein YvbJ
MAFCNSCGKELVSGTKFCNQCGASVSASPASAPSAIPAPPAKSGSALKVVLIVVAVIVGLGILGVAGVSYVTYRAVTSPYRAGKNVHIAENDSNMKVDTPFGTIESSQDPEKVSKNLGIDIYPGAQMKKNGAVESTFGKMHTMTAIFETSDSADQVCNFYKSRFPNTAVANTFSSNCSFVSNDPSNMLTMNIQSMGGSTRIQITSVTKKPSN